MSSRGLPAPGSKKLKTESKKSRKVEISTLFQLFDSFSTLFLTFGALGPEGPGNSFSAPFPTLGPKGPRTPLGGWKGRKSRLFLSIFLGEGKWGRKKYRRIPKCEGDWQGRVPMCSLPRKTLQNEGFGAPKFSGISPKLFAALRRIQPYPSVHPYFPMTNFS